MASRIRIALALAGTLTLGAAAGAALADGENGRPPWGERCRVELRAYEDGSASLYCRGRRNAFGSVDAESGRLRLPWPTRSSPGRDSW